MMEKLLLNWKLWVILAVVAAYLAVPYKALGQTAEQPEVLVQAVGETEEETREEPEDEEADETDGDSLRIVVTGEEGSR